VGTGSVAERLERSEVVVYPTCPFTLPSPEDRAFLFDLRMGFGRHKNISYDPQNHRLGGASRPDSSRLRSILAGFSHVANEWLSAILPEYGGRCRPDRVSFRPLEEATRNLRLTARNDLLHIDSFPTRPSGGWRLLRLFVNVNPTEQRVWVTSDSFARLLDKYGPEAGLPGSSPPSGWAAHVFDWLPRLFGQRQSARSEYDSFMLRFHHFLKRCDDLQERGQRRVWSFSPGSAWLAMTDSVSHGELRGRFALEYSYFVDPSALLFPELSPASLLAAACGRPLLPLAA